MTRPYHGFFVDVGGVGEREERDRRSRIWTVMVDPDGDCKDPGLPLVLVHGYLCGSALWVLNLESFAKDRIVYSIDLPGFGKSSRPKLSKDAALAEEQLAQGKSSLDSLRSRRRDVHRIHPTHICCGNSKILRNFAPRTISF